MSIIKSENWDSVSAPALPSGWTVDSFYLKTATTNSPTSAPNSLVYPLSAADIAIVPHATWATPDTNSGNVQVSGTMRFAGTGAGAGEQDLWVFARASAVAANSTWGTISYYYAGIHGTGSAHALVLTKRLSGTDTVLGTVGSGAFADATNYRVALLCKDSAISVSCQRLSDGFWLNSAGTFVADATDSTVAISVVDTALAATAGYAGVAAYFANASGGTAGLDDWLLETPPARLVASPASLPAGSGNQNVTLSGTGTNFSTTSSTQFTLSGGTGASIVSQSASSATDAALVINPGSAAGTLTLTDTTDGIATQIALTRPAATYYVSNAGSDTNNGTSSSTPWQTIGHVNAQTFQAGDQILFQGGQSFSGNLLIQNSGTALAPIVIGSYGTGKATLSCANGTGVQVSDADHIHISNLTIQGSGVTVSGATSSTTSTGYGIYVNNTTTQLTNVGTYRTGHRIDNVTVSGCYGGIYFVSDAGGNTSPFPVGFNDARITNCTVHDCLVNGICIIAGASLNVSFANASGQPAFNKNIYIANCVTYNIYGASAVTTIYTGSGIVLNNCTTSLIERCLAYNCGQASGNLGGGPVGIWFNETTYSTIQYCEVHHQHDGKNIDAEPWDFDGGTQNCVIQYCYSHDNDGPCVLTGTYGGSNATSNNTFRYNVSQNDGRTKASVMWVEDYSGTATGMVLHNNTFCCSGVGSGTSNCIRAGSASFYNNIFYCGGTSVLLASVSAGAYVGNLYWFGGRPFSVTYGGTTYTSLSAFQAVQETVNGVPTGVWADPVLRAPAAGGTLMPAAPVGFLDAYDLGPSSPAIDSGLDLRTLFGVEGGPIDYRGRPNRAGAGCDIGACEYGAAALLSGGGGGVLRVTLSGGMGG